MELSTIEKSSATIGVVQNGTLVYEHCGQQVMVTVDTPSWYTWLETATAFTFVCEEDVRLAIQAGRKLLVAERAIVTPAARDLANEHQVLTIAPWIA